MLDYLEHRLRHALCGYEPPSSLLHLLHHKPICYLKVVLLAQLFVSVLNSDIEAQIFGELKHARLVWENFVGLLELILILDCEVGRDVLVQVSQELKSHLSCDA